MKLSKKSLHVFSLWIKRLTCKHFWQMEDWNYPELGTVCHRCGKRAER